MQTFVLPTSTDLLWFEEAGYGLLPLVEPDLYGPAYFAEYQARDASEMGEKLTRARVEMVARNDGAYVVDIGIGGGRFITDRNLDCGYDATFGYDVNPEAIRWLKRNDLWADVPGGPYGRFDLSFWDSFEHIPDPSVMLARAYRVFMSIPIFRDRDHALSSKHYKPGEHIYYFTHAGLIRFMNSFGFQLIEANTMESDLGREGIESFYFRRM